MAQNTAQYEALQYSSQAPVIDFSQITKGVNEVVEKKRAEDERKAKELEAQKLELLKEYGDEIYSDFEMTGLENTDQLAFNTKSLILEMAEDTNRRLANGEISMVDASREMMMARNQSKKASTFFSELSGYAETIRSKGPEASPADNLKLDAVDNMITNGVSVGRDGKNKFLLLAKRDGKIVPSPFGSLSKYITFSENIKPESIIEAVMSNSQTNTYDDGKGVVFTSKLSKNNTLTENQKAGFREFLGSIDNEELYNAAVNSGVEVSKEDYDLNGEVIFKDAQSIRNKTLEAIEKKAQIQYGNPALDEKSGKLLKAQLDKLSNDKEKKDEIKKTKDTKGRDVFLLDISKQKGISYSFKVSGGDTGFGPQTQKEIQYENFKVNSYTPGFGDNPDIVSITFKEPVVSTDQTSQLDKIIGYRDVTKEIQVSDKTDQDFIKAQFDIVESSSNIPSKEQTPQNTEQTPQNTSNNPGDLLFL